MDADEYFGTRSFFISNVIFIRYTSSGMGAAGSGCLCFQRYMMVESQGKENVM